MKVTKEFLIITIEDNFYLDINGDHFRLKTGMNYFNSVENALNRAIPNFHNLTSIDNVSDDSITVTYNVRESKRL